MKNRKLFSLLLALLLALTLVACDENQAGAGRYE